MARLDAKGRTNFLKAASSLYETVSHAFAQEPGYPRTSVNERERCTAAIHAFAQFFSRLGDKQTGSRLFELGSALGDLNSGTVHPLLEPVPAANRRADPSQPWRARARAVLGLEALERSGLSRDAAAAHLARKVPNAAKLAGAKARTSDLRTTILGWRKRLLAGRVKNFEGHELLLAGRERIRDLPKQDPRLVQFAERQLIELTEFLGALSPRS